MITFFDLLNDSNLIKDYDDLLLGVDNVGNKLYCDSGIILIKLSNETRVRNIGKLIRANHNRIYYKFEDESQIFRKFNAWSINFACLKKVDLVVFQTNKGYYTISKEKALRVGKFLQFADQSIELKIYVPIQDWSFFPFNSDSIKNSLTWVNRLGADWFFELKNVCESEEMNLLSSNIKKARLKKKVFPESKNVFRAFRETSFSNTKVCIIGQDPYTSPDNQATGLAFDCGVSVSPSMKKIIDEINEQYPSSFLGEVYNGKLAKWTDQGVLLLNSALTVSENKRHYVHWYFFMKEVINKLNSKGDMIFALIGSQAIESFQHLIHSPNKVFTCEHPAAACYRQGSWKSNKLFININQALILNKKEGIEW